MDILAGRKSVGNLTGVVTVNGKRRDNDDFRRKTAYVPQVRDVHRQRCPVAWPRLAEHVTRWFGQLLCVYADYFAIPTHTVQWCRCLFGWQHLPLCSRL